MKPDNNNCDGGPMGPVVHGTHGDPRAPGTHGPVGTLGTQDSGTQDSGPVPIVLSPGHPRQKL